MWGAVLWETGDVELEVRDDLELLAGPGPGQVQVRVHATGLCHSDLSGMTGLLPAPIPALLGHEAAGEVVAVGEGVAHVRVGDHVIVAWVPPCGRCSFCLGGQANLCDSVADPFDVKPTHRAGDAEISPFGNVGSFVEEIILPEQGVVVIPADVPPDIASILGCAVMTGVGAAVNAARVVPGSSVVVFGCGGVGMSIIQGARLCGAADIVAIDLVAERREAALRLGATHAITPGEIARVGDGIHDGIGFDYGFEAVGLPRTIRDAYDSVRRGGTVVVVGAGGLDQTVEFTAFELFYLEKTLIGTVYGSADVRRDFHRLLRLWRAGRLDLEGMVTRRLKITEINDGLNALRGGEGIRQVVEFT
jgi:S-(hydroxymethyl)glutathione dehydrogenase/alcohol dehydrogenase